MPGNMIWGGGDEYERFMGRWSRLVSAEFLKWLNLPGQGRWLDVGCGTGVLSETILHEAAPQSVTGIDPSEDQIALARQRVISDRASFHAIDLTNFADDTEPYNAVVSGLVLNFMADRVHQIDVMKNLVTEGGTVGAYVWDYAGRMEFLRYFWDTATTLNADAAALDEGKRFLICKPEPLRELFSQAGLDSVEVRPIDVETTFDDFDDFWLPFLGGRGPAGAYVTSLDQGEKSALLQALFDVLPITENGRIPLIARAWAVRGIRS